MDQEPTYYNNSINKNRYLHTFDIKIEAARNLNNQNISSSDFIFIAETLDQIYHKTTSGDYQAAIIEIQELIKYLKIVARELHQGSGVRVLTEALITLLDSIIMVLINLEITENKID